MSRAPLVEISSILNATRRLPTDTVAGMRVGARLAMRFSSIGAVGELLRDIMPSIRTVAELRA